MYFNIGDIVYTPNYPDVEYEKKCRVNRSHSSFFGKVSEIQEYGNETCFTVKFDSGEEWVYHADELRLASDLKDMTLEAFCNQFGVMINGTYL